MIGGFKGKVSIFFLFHLGNRGCALFFFFVRCSTDTCNLFELSVSVGLPVDPHEEMDLPCLLSLLFVSPQLPQCSPSWTGTSKRRSGRGRWGGNLGDILRGAPPHTAATGSDEKIRRSGWSRQHPGAPVSSNSFFFCIYPTRLGDRPSCQVSQARQPVSVGLLVVGTWGSFVVMWFN